MASLANSASFDVPYRAFLDHIEMVEPVEAFLAAAKRGERSDLNYTWASGMFSLLERQVMATHGLLCHMLKHEPDIVERVDAGRALEEGNETKTPLFILPPVGVHGDFDYINYLDDVLPNVKATHGFLELLAFVVENRGRIERREIIALPERLTVTSSSFPDGGHINEVDSRTLLAALA
jgi:hypothetical protein